MTHLDKALLDLDHHVSELECWLCEAEAHEADFTDLVQHVNDLRCLTAELDTIRESIKEMVDLITQANEVNI